MSDIFVAFPPATADDVVIFGKNSDRPPSEVQEVVYYRGQEQNAGSKLKCTLIEVEQVGRTYDVLLSKPAWSWGAEMGANQHGVCAGCTSVWTKLCHSGDHEEKLIGVDFVRLALERSASAKEALDVITSLLEKYGQGGVNSEDSNFGQWSYHNAFLLADNTEAWVLNTAGKFWAAKKFTSGVHNISSMLSIETDMDATSSGLENEAEAAGYWKADMGQFNFSKAFSAEFSGLSLSEKQLPNSRLKSGKELLDNFSKDGNFCLERMMTILRDENSFINLCGDLRTMGSQISVLQKPNSNIPHCHWMTGTPNASISCFKPFFFCPDADIGKMTTSSTTSGDRRHVLYKAQEKRRQNLEAEGSKGEDDLMVTLHTLEKQCIEDLNSFMSNFSKDVLEELSDLFKDIAESEVKFYR